MTVARITLLLAAVGLAGLVLAALANARELAFATNVAPLVPAVTLAPGQGACQGPIDAPEPFDVLAAYPTLPGRPLELRVGRPGGRPRSLPTVPERGRARARAALPRLVEGPVVVCARNAGRLPVTLLGQPTGSAGTSPLTVEGRPVPGDLALAFERRDAPSLLARTPLLAQRAALFRPGWMGPWTFTLVVVAVALAPPILLARSAAQAVKPDRRA